MKRCKHCGQILARGEKLKDHYEICGGLMDEEAESMDDSEFEERYSETPSLYEIEHN